MNAPAATTTGVPGQGVPRRGAAWRLLAVLGWSLLVLALLTLTFALVLAGAFAEWGDGVRVSIDGQSFELGQLHLGHAMAAAAGIALAALVVCAVVPMALLVALLAVLFGLAVALLSVFGVATLVMSPLLLVVGLGWLIWWLARRKPAPRA